MEFGTYLREPNSSPVYTYIKKKQPAVLEKIAFDCVICTTNEKHTLLVRFRFRVYLGILSYVDQIASILKGCV